MSAAKLLNLQGIRGIAILAVLGFHFFPNFIPNGYLGVDQFFVLSGFLMCMLLTKTEKLEKFQMITNFYIRRFKRILPLYQFVILLSLIALYLIFPDTTIEVNINSAKKAIFFISNQLKTLDDDYFEKLNMAIDIFTHTWSLSVEIQFYLIVPFLFLLPFRFISLTVIAIISLLYFYILPSDTAFLNVFARTWQFLIGMIAFIFYQKISDNYEPVQNSDEVEKQQLISEEEETVETGKLINYELITRLIILTMIIAIFFPKNMMADVARPIITITTGIILTFSKEDDIILSNKILTYIGDISYSLYLIHWPITSYCKITGIPHHNCIIVFLFASVMFSMLIYHGFEKWYTQQSNIITCIIIILFFIVNFGILNHQLFIPNSLKEETSKSLDELMGNKTLEDAKRLNHQWNVDDLKNIRFRCDKVINKMCMLDGIGTSNLKIMSFGNSWTDNHAKIMYEECGSKVKQFLRRSTGGCEPLYKFPTKFKNCPEFAREIEHILEEFKPDYAFHITRSMEIGTKYISDFEHDPIYQSILDQTRHLVQNVKQKLFILNSIPPVTLAVIEGLADDLKNKLSKEAIDKKMNKFHDHHLAASRIYSQLIKDCGSKCELIDYSDLFHSNGTKTFRYYDDNGFAYMSGGNHFTPYGLEYLRPFWKDFCAKKLV